MWLPCLTNAVKVKVMKAKILLALLLAGLVQLPGCATDTPRARELQTTLDLYRKTVRWESPRTAAQFIDPQVRPNERQLDFKINRMAQFNVTSYNLLGPGAYLAEGEYGQTVEIRLENRHTARERVVVDQQIWRWDGDKQRWWLVSGLPDLDRS